MEDLPVLLIWGARDPVIPLHHGERAAEAIPNSELVVFRGSAMNLTSKIRNASPNSCVTFSIGYAD